jgi:hypothetical protein
MRIVSKITQSINRFAQQYGRLGLIVYLSISTLSLTSCYLAVRAGLDTRGVMRRLGIELDENQERFGNLVGAYAVHKLLLPLRLSATVFLTGMISKMRKTKI